MEEKIKGLIIEMSKKSTMERVYKLRMSGVACVLHETIGKTKLAKIDTRGGVSLMYVGDTPLKQNGLKGRYSWYAILLPCDTV